MATASRILTIIVSASLWISAAHAQSPTTLAEQRARQEPASAVPAIVSTSPEAMQTDVDPALDRIEVTFDQPMRDRSWSWTGGGDTYPQLTGKPSYDAQRMTCTLPVKLEPGKVYWVGVNSPSHRNFVSEKGEPAKWYIILFATRSADGKPTPLPKDREQMANAINQKHQRPQANPTSQPAAPKR